MIPYFVLEMRSAFNREDQVAIVPQLKRDLVVPHVTASSHFVLNADRSSLSQQKY